MGRYSISAALGRAGVLFLFLGAALAACPSAARADEIRLRHGATLSGEVLTSDSARLRVRVEGAEMEIPLSRVQSVVLSSQSENLARRGMGFLRKGKVLDGLDCWRRAAAETGGEAQTELFALDALLRERGEEIQEAMGWLAPPEAARAIEPLETLAQCEALSLEARVACLRALLRLNSVSKVREILARLDSAALNASPPGRLFAREFWRGEIRRRLVTGEYAAALEAIERLRLHDAEAGRAHEALLHLSRIGEAREEGRLLDALRIALRDLLPALPEVGRNRLESLLKDLPAWAAGPAAPPGRFDEARRFLEEELAAAQPLEARAALELLILEHARALLAAGETTATLRLLGGAAPGGEGPLRDLALEAEYLRRRAALAPGGLPALLDLAQWAAEAGRADWALDLYTQCLGSPALQEAAQARIDLLLEKRRADLLAQAIEHFDKDRILDALNTLSPFLEDTTPSALQSPYREKAMRIVDLARRSLDDQARRRPYQAEVIFQQAERAYFAGDYEPALQKIAEVLRDYPETPAARRADQLLPQLLRDIELEHLAGARRPLPVIPEDLRARLAADPSRLDQEIRTLLDSLEPDAGAPAPPLPSPRADNRPGNPPR